MTEMNISKLKVLFIDWFNTLTSRAFLHKLRQDDPQLFSRIDQKIFDQSPTGWHLEWARGKIGQEEVAEIIARDGLLSKQEVLDIFADCCKHQNVDNEEIWEVIAKIRKRGGYAAAGELCCGGASFLFAHSSRTPAARAMTACDSGTASHTPHTSSHRGSTNRPSSNAAGSP